MRLGSSVIDFFWQRAQHDVQLTNMLNKLSFATRRIRAVESHNIRIEKTHAFDLQDTRVAARKAHGDFMFVIKLLFKVLDVEDQTLVGPFRRAFRLGRLITQTIRALVARFAIASVLFKAALAKRPLPQLRLKS